VFTVLEALIQQNKGTLRLDDDVRSYLDEFRLFEDAKSKVTLRALGSHLSGLGRDSKSVGSHSDRSFDKRCQINSQTVQRRNAR
jgi:CubicO group peptidase (beta-lactamase class C family)